METIVLKFGGSSLSDNTKLNIVAQKIIKLHNDKTNIIAVLSAQQKNYR